MGVLAAVGVLAGCGKSGSSAGGGNPPPVEVSVFTVEPESVVVSTELPGRLEAVRVAEVRARVAGILQKKLYEEGTTVKQGDVLFQIDPAPFQAAVNNAAAAVARAEATLRQAEVQEERYEKLLAAKAISKQEYDNAVASAAVARAEVQAAKANLETAELNLSYATVTAPISGFISKAFVTEGALVGQGETTKLAVIQEMDSIYFDFKQSSTEWLRLQRSFLEGKLKGLENPHETVTLILEDGSVYPHPGKILFSDVTVDQSTGNVTIRAKFPNPERILLPGMFGRVKVGLAVKNNAILVPQRAVSRGPNGSSTVLLVNAENKVEVRSIQANDAVGDRWIVTDGLAAGERVIVEGHLKVRPGGAVTTVPFGGAKPSVASTKDGASKAAQQ